MKKILFLFTLLMLIGCKQKDSDINYGGTLESIKTEQIQTGTMVESTTRFNSSDFTKYCYAKKIPRSIKKWDTSQLVEFETGKVTTKYLYMPSYKEVYSMTLNINGNDTTFIVTNRIQH